MSVRRVKVRTKKKTDYENARFPLQSTRRTSELCKCKMFERIVFETPTAASVNLKQGVAGRYDNFTFECIRIRKGVQYSFIANWMSCRVKIILFQTNPYYIARKRSYIVGSVRPFRSNYKR